VGTFTLGRYTTPQSRGTGLQSLGIFAGNVMNLRVWAGARTMTEIYNSMNHVLVSGVDLSSCFQFNDAQGVDLQDTCGAASGVLRTVERGHLRDSTASWVGTMPFVAPILAESHWETDAFVATDCLVVVPHASIQCQVGEGVGRRQKWTVFVDEQASVTATTAYGPPIVTHIDGPVAEARTIGGQNITLRGHNFGERIEWIDSISYGPNGDEYVVHDSRASVGLRCWLVVPHFAIKCTTRPGVGRNLRFLVTVAGQVTPVDASMNGPMLSYQPPRIDRVVFQPVDSPQMPGTTYGRYEMALVGQYFGASDSLHDPYYVSFYGQYAEILEASEKNDTYVRILIPEGQGANLPVTVVQVPPGAIDSCIQQGVPYNYSYQAPAIDRLISTELGTGMTRLTLRGALRNARGAL
jgi:hypothetical protein